MPGMTMGSRSAHVHLGTPGDAMLRKPYDTLCKYFRAISLYPIVLGFHP